MGQGSSCGEQKVMVSAEVEEKDRTDWRAAHANQEQVDRVSIKPSFLRLPCRLPVT